MVVSHADAAVEHQSVSAVLRRVADSLTNERISIGDMVGAFGERAFGLALILFCLPNCIPVPGLGSLFGIPLLVLALQMAIGRPAPWLPASMTSRSLEAATFRRMVDLVEPRLIKVEAVLKPRLTFLFSKVADRLIGVFVALCAISIIIPLPGTNFPPAIAVILISLAVMEEDGLVLLIGLAIGVVGLTYTTILVGGLIWAAILGMGAAVGT
jgi:hypothetical protein